MKVEAENSILSFSTYLPDSMVYISADSHIQLVYNFIRNVTEKPLWKLHVTNEN